MWHLGTWLSGGLGSVRLMIGINDLKDIFQPKWFYDSMVLFSPLCYKHFSDNADCQNCLWRFGLWRIFRIQQSGVNGTEDTWSNQISAV